MGKATPLNDTVEQEFAKLEQLLIQTADEAFSCLKALKNNLSEYDKRHGLLFLNTSRSFMRCDIRAAKDKAAELKHVAYHINKSERPSESEITATRSKIHEVSDAMLHLKQTARAYDRKNHLESLSELKAEERRSNPEFSKSESEGSWFSEDTSSDRSGNAIRGATDRVEIVLKSTIRHNFSGFSALKHQVSVAEEALSPSIVDHVMNTMASMSKSLKGEDNFEKKSVNV
ncbi:hypothetical protein F441_05448 [Phytophthora nicotianae CJ01A1]|uniref:Uncharacterized protein n=3 Tax=Phytophthora nicotianae TaxID=4792 RepID=W2Z792_PHYNI|nr:hypothetical protein L915_09864 [Phytophthora nicotianae]ETP15158.1 hypothetical protein F441_10013 [Phytophthora nicotianae CJ01A1]ETP43212.1 hypothetical protein F442_09978 [Phytophthora nicotianae P10297]KUF67229.1 hypothetical protein AM587_10014808 [Phytophthora nicotianae]ETL38692.1 hypothetical protein L916_09773 [Phytophthora nicotianae]